MIPPGWHPKHVESGWLQGFIHMMTAKPRPEVPVIHHWGDIPYTTWESPGVPPITGSSGPKGTASDPLHTLSHVTNPGDIHNGAAKAIAHQLTGRQNGPSGFDYSFMQAIPGGSYQ